MTPETLREQIDRLNQLRTEDLQIAWNQHASFTTQTRIAYRAVLMSRDAYYSPEVLPPWRVKDSAANDAKTIAALRALQDLEDYL